jgi:hypothetical protein
MINVTQLPMVAMPNRPDQNGKYFPYIHSEISHIYNSFDTVVKKKFEIRDQVENQQVLNKTINYLKKTAFTINNEVLNFILSEWNTLIVHILMVLIEKKLLIKMMIKRLK